MKDYKKIAIELGQTLISKAPETREDVERMLPELKESEDDGVRKTLIRFFEDWRKTRSHCWGVSIQKILAWLEKQGEHKKFCDSIQVGDKVTKNEYGVLVNLSQLNRFAKKDEKQGEQKPASFEIPLLEKFKQAVYDCAWGKVTCKSEGETQDEYAERWAEQLLSIVRDWADDYIDSREDTIRRGAYDKAIKEQKPAWREEDEIGLVDALWAIQQARTIAKDENDMGNIWYAENWLKSLRPQNRWKPSDEQMEALYEATLEGEPVEALETLLSDLKKLKG